jgi:hypothetical protein
VCEFRCEKIIIIFIEMAVGKNVIQKSKTGSEVIKMFNDI